MPFSFGESINHISDAILNAPSVSLITRSPMWMAVVITLIVVLIFLIVFRDVESEESIFLLAGRGAFWVFLMLVGALFLHNKVLTREVDTGKSMAVYDGVYGAGETTGYTMPFDAQRVPIMNMGVLP